jgi:hypothetical protein
MFVNAVAGMRLSAPVPKLSIEVIKQGRKGSFPEKGEP